MQQELAPTVEVDATAYAFLLSSINPWPMPPSLRKRLQTAELDGMQLMNATCSMSMTFYHSKSRRFYGSTWVGHEHTCTIKSSSTKIVLENFNELTYFFTRVHDPYCFIVIELIMNILSPLNGSISGRLGCGWAIVNPFLGESKSNGRICLFDGSPRRLLELKGSRASILEQLTKQNKATSASVVSFTIWRLEGLMSRAIPQCIKENQIVGAHTSIAGLRRTTVNYFDERGSIVETCIGAATHGNILDWEMSPPLGDTSILEKSQILKASDICVTLPRRSQFERTLESWITHSLPKEKNTMRFGWKKSTKCLSTTSLIMQPKLSIGAHNGNTILCDQWHEVELCSIGDADDLDRLYAKEDVEINSYVNHPACALLCKVEYLCVQTTKSLQSPTKTVSHQSTVVVGMALFFPPLGEKKRSAVMLNIENDVRCQILCNDPIFSLQQGSDSPQSFVKFVLFTSESHGSGWGNSTTTGCLDYKDDDANWENTSNDLDIDEERLCADGTNIASPTVDIPGETNTKDIDPGPGTEDKSDTKAMIPVEVADRNRSTSVIVTLRTFAPSLSCPESASKAPNSLSFLMKFHDYDEVLTNHTLKEVEGIAKFTHPASFSFVYDYSTADTAEELALYLMERDLYIEVYDSSTKYIGTLSLPMHLFLRQGRDSKVLENLSVDIIAPEPDKDTFHLNNKATIGRVAGSIILSIYCVGSESETITSTHRPGPKRVIARSLLETSHSEGRSVASDICQYDEQRRENDEIVSHRLVPHGIIQGIDNLQGQRHKERENNMMHSFFHNIAIEHGQEVVQCRVLKEIQWTREGEKQALISLHVLQSEEKIFFIRPWLGQKVIGTYSFSRQLPKAEAFVEVSHPGVRIIPKTQRLSRMEAAIYDVSGEFELEFDCMDTVPVTVTVSLVSARTRQVVEKFKIQVQPRLRVDRRFIITGIENENVRKTIIPGKASIRIVNKTTMGGITTNEKSTEPNADDVDSKPKKNDVHIEFCCPVKTQPFSERFYAIFSQDKFVTLYEAWEFIVNVQPAPLMPNKCGWKGVFDFSDSRL